MMEEFLSRRFIVVTGKGGVGKTTTCNGLAMALHNMGKRVLLCRAHLGTLGDHTHRRQRLRPTPSPNDGDLPLQVPGSLEVMEVTPQRALREYGLMKLKLETIYKMVFQNRLAQGLLEVIPGLPELLVLGKIWHHEQERDPKTGQPRWDTVIVDAPATGHCVPFLTIPEVVLRLFSGGPMAEDSKKILSLLQDPSRTLLCIVTIPEEMALTEAHHLKVWADTTVSSPDLNWTVLLINRIIPRFLPARLDPHVDEILTSTPSRETGQMDLQGILQSLHRRRRTQEHMVAEASNLGMPTMFIPLFLQTQSWPGTTQPSPNGPTLRMASFFERQDLAPSGQETP